MTSRGFFLPFALLTLALAACGAPNTPSPTLAPPTLPAAAPLPTPNRCVDVRLPTPNPGEKSLFPPVSAAEHVRSAAQAPNPAPVTVLMYANFQCTDCAKIAAALEAVRQNQPETLRIVYRHALQPASYDKSLLTAQAAEAAAKQGKFWELHDLLFSSQAEWAALPPENFSAWMETQLAGLGLDPAVYAADLKSADVQQAVSAAALASQQVSQVPLPLLLINGEIVKNPYILVNLDSLVRLYALPARQFSTCPNFTINPAKTYTATLETSRGEVVIRLFAERAPNTVNNFIFLARQGWYEKVPFHKVIPGLLAQTGDPTGTGLGNPGYFIPDEPDPTLQFDRAGMLAMFNVGPDTNGSQFFITLGPAPALQNGYTIFGEVIRGLDVLTSLAARDPAAGGTLAAPEMLISVSIEEK